MRIKIGDKIYTSTEQPIMVILTESDKRNIRNMHPDATRYAEFSDGLDWTQEQKEEWMDDIPPDG